ncbi:unnamed protein product, partial [marine sediment metagenome]
DGLVVDNSDWDNQLYRFVNDQQKCFRISAIPYYAWSNRERSEMQVWIRTDA